MSMDVVRSSDSLASFEAVQPANCHRALVGVLQRWRVEACTNVKGAVACSCYVGVEIMVVIMV